MISILKGAGIVIAYASSFLVLATAFGIVLSILKSFFSYFCYIGVSASAISFFTATLTTVFFLFVVLYIIDKVFD